MFFLSVPHTPHPFSLRRRKGRMREEEQTQFHFLPCPLIPTPSVYICARTHPHTHTQISAKVDTLTPVKLDSERPNYSVCVLAQLLKRARDLNLEFSYSFKIGSCRSVLCRKPRGLSWVRFSHPVKKTQRFRPHCEGINNKETALKSSILIAES